MDSFTRRGFFFSDRGEVFRGQCAKQAEPISREQFMLWIVAGEPQKCRDYFAHWMDECRKRKAEGDGDPGGKALSGMDEGNCQTGYGGGV